LMLLDLNFKRKGTLPQMICNTSFQMLE